MQVTVSKNLIFDGIFYRTGETCDLPDEKIAEFTRRGFISAVSKPQAVLSKPVNGALPAQIDNVEELAELPPLELQVSKPKTAGKK